MSIITHILAALGGGIFSLLFTAAFYADSIADEIADEIETRMEKQHSGLLEEDE